MLLTRSTLAVLAFAALSVPATSQDKSFKHALPANTILVLTAPDIDTSIKEFKSTPLYLMWKEGETQEFAAGPLKLASKWLEERLEVGRQAHKAGSFPFPPDDLLKLRVHSATLALTSVDVGSGALGPVLKPRLGLMIHLDFGDSAPGWRKVIEYGLETLEHEAGEQMDRSESEIEGVKLITFSSPVTRASMSLNVAFVGTGVVVGTLQDEVEAAIRNHVTGKAVLTASKNYKETTKRLGVQGAEAELYFQPEVVVDTVMKVLRFMAEEADEFPPELNLDGVDRAITALGLRSYKAIGVSTQYEGNKTVTSSFYLSPEPVRKGFVAVGSKDLKLDFLKWVPKDVTEVSARTFNAMAIYDGLLAAIKAYDEETADQLLQMLKTYEKKFGMTLKEDLFGTVGDHYVWWSMGWPNFLQAPEWVVLVKIKNEARLLKTLETLVDLSDGYVELVASTRRGVKTYRLRPNASMLPEGQALILANFEPHFAFKKGYLVAAWSRGDVRLALRRLDRDDDDPKGDLRSNEAFASYLGLLPKERVNYVSWTDWRNTFEKFYQAAVSALAIGSMVEDMPFDLTLLPESETLSKHLFASMSWSVASGDGFHSTTISPIGPEITVVGVGLIGGGLSVGLYASARGGGGGPVVVGRVKPVDVMEPDPPTDPLKPVEAKPVKQPPKKKEEGKKQPPKGGKK